MIALLLAGYGLMAQAPCATIDQHDEGWALVRLPEGDFIHLPFPVLAGLPLEGARLCPSGLQPRPPRRRGRPLLSAHTQLEEFSL